MATGIRQQTSAAALRLIHVLDQVEASLEHRAQPAPTVFTQLGALIHVAGGTPQQCAQAKQFMLCLEQCIAHRMYGPAKTYLRKLAATLEIRQS